MNTQRIYELFVSFGILTTMAFVSERSHVLASVLSVMPLNITFGLWFISTRADSSAALLADYSRMATFGLIPTMLFTAACWFGFRQGWPFGRVVVVGYVVWLVAMGLYRGVEWWLQTPR